MSLERVQPSRSVDRILCQMLLRWYEAYDIALSEYFGRESEIRGVPDTL